MPVATGDAFRYITTTGTNVGESDATLIAPDVNGTLTIAGGFGITLTADAANRKITITNTGNGTGALTTITAQNSAGTYYPVFTTIPGTYNPATGTYTNSTLYYESTTTPLSYNPGTGTLNVNNLVLGGAGTFSLDGVTSTGVTGTGNLVFGTSPTITSPQILTNAFIGPTTSANSTRFPNALAVFSTTTSGIQQNESHNIGVMGEGVANSSNTAIYGVGVYGAGYTASATRSGGVVGEGHVSASADTGSAIGVRGYANDTHAGGTNIGLYGDATNGANNYSLYLNNGSVYNNYALTWTMNGNITFSGAYTVTIPTLNLTNALGVSYGGTGTGTAGITAFNNITGYTASGATGTTSTNLVFSTSPTITTPTISGHFTAEGVTTTGATGTGKLVFDGSPTLTTPTLGVATATSINKMAITAPATSSTLAVADGKTFTVSNTITLAGTDSTTITLPSTTGTVPLNNQTFYIGTTSVAINRATANLALTGISSVAFPGSTSGTATLQATATAGTPTLSLPITTGTLIGTGDSATVTNTMLANPSFYIGSTSITLGRATASQSLTGITSIDGYAAGLAGGTTGAIHYQSGVNTSAFLSGNTSTTPNFLTSTGTGSAAQAPTLTSSTGSGSVVLGTNPSLTAPTWGNSSNTTDADYTFDASAYGYSSWIVSFTAARNLNISNLTAGRRAVIYIRNTNASTRTITINASTTATGFTGVNLALGAGAASATSITLAATSGTAVVYVWNANGNLVGMVN